MIRFIPAVLVTGILLLAWVGGDSAQPPPMGCPVGCAGCDQPQFKKVCISEPTTKKIKKQIYCCKAVDYCVKRPCWLTWDWWFHRGPQPMLPNADHLHHGGCCMTCGRVRTRHVALKKTVTCEVPDFKCKAVLVPCEHTAPAAFPHLQSLWPSGEELPAPKTVAPPVKQKWNDHP